jgi:hypothetical protein
MILSGILAVFFWEGHQGFSMSDEGFLWYGAQRVIAGEVPFRDFDSYDIGRYYWSAAFMRLLSDNGIVTVRIAAIIFQAMALCIGFWAIVRYSIKQNIIYWAILMITLMAWMVHRHKLFDISIPIILISSLSLLVDHPSRRLYFLTGFIVGLVAVFGRNHGLYGALGSFSIILYLTIKHKNTKTLITAFLFWSLGIIVGYLPVLAFLIFVPGFTSAFWKIISPVLLFEIKATNIPLPVPWPWRFSFEQMSVDVVRSMVMGTYFISIIFFGIFSVLWTIRQRIYKKSVSPVLVASAFMALPYTHYAFSRADLSHLAYSIPPLMIGLFILLEEQSKKIKWSFAALLCGTSLFLMLPVHPGWICSVKNHCVNVKVADDNLKVPFKTALILKDLNHLVQQYVPSERNFLCAPFCPAAYAIMGRKSPIWSIYATGPSKSEFQQAEIERIKVANPSLIIIDNSPLDGQNNLQFSNTNPLIDRYIRNNFQRLNEVNQNLAIYVSKTARD